MTSSARARLGGLLGLVVFVLGMTIPARPAAATSSPVPVPATPSAGSPTPSLIPPYAGDDAPRPVRSRQDRIISTMAPIAMVVVLAAGLYIYWLIRKGL